MIGDSSDLAPLLTAVASSEGQLRLGLGKILEWDSETLENKVSVHGTVFTNRPVLAGAAALTYQADDHVMMIGFDPGGQGGATNWGVLGRFITPGTEAGRQQVDFLRARIGREVARSVLGEAIKFANVFGSETLADTNSGNDYTDLGSPAEENPVITDINISKAGLALVIFGAQIRVDTHTTDAQIVEGRMSIEVSGATSISPGTGIRALEVGHTSQTIDTSDNNEETNASAATAVMLTLNEGAHKIAGKYAALVTDNPTQARVTFNNRFLIVIPF